MVFSVGGYDHGWLWYRGFRLLLVSTWCGVYRSCSCLLIAGHALWVIYSKPCSLSFDRIHVTIIDYMNLLMIK